MKRVPWSIFLIVVSVLLTIQCVLGSNSISSFIVKSWNFKNNTWVKGSDIFPRKDVRLECTTTEPSQVNELHIKRAGGFPLSKNHKMSIQNETQLVVLKSVACSQMGTYVCENGRGDKKTVDLGIYDCPSQPCKDQNTSITLYISVNKTRHFSVCVEAFPNVSSVAFFNGNQVRFDRSNEIPGVNCTRNKSEEVFSTYNISCTIKVGGDVGYGIYNLSIPSGETRGQTVSFTVQIEKPGPPECPTSIISINQERDSIILSWQPVNNKGGIQPIGYTIFYTTNDSEWQRYSKVQDTQATISGLKADIRYKFRVASSNEYSQEIDESTCKNTFVGKTGTDVTSSTTSTTTKTATTTTTRSTSLTVIGNTGAKSDNVAKDVKEVLTPIVIVLIVLATIVVVAVVVGIVVCIKLRKLQTSISRSASLATMAYHSSQRSLATPRGEDVTVRLMEYSDRGAASPRQGAGRYVSREGLTYVTIDHSNSRPNSGRRKSEKVTYATLDPINTGKYTVSEIPSDKEYENIVLT